MARFVVLSSALIVLNVIRLNVGEPYDPGPGNSILQVPESTIVSEGQMYEAGSNPPTFIDAPDTGGGLETKTPAELLAEGTDLNEQARLVNEELMRQLGGG